MNIALKNISIELPVTDIAFVEILVRKMGWTLKSQEDVHSPAENISAKSDTNTNKQYSPRILHLRSLRGSGITQKEIEDDERLAYLLNR